MSAVPEPDRPKPTVFLSYASEDRKAAQAIRDALPAYGLEVWYDESALDGGDAWDQKIRRQIRECDFFMPLISAQTEVRPEGYFRREWRLAVERTLDMADDHTFLLPVVIDGTVEAGARVPDKFLTVQWMRLPGGQPTPALEALCRRLVSGQAWTPPPRRPPQDPQVRSPARPARAAYPQFPREEPGQRVRFWVHVLGWVLQCGWVFISRFPKWIRILAAVWLGIALVSRGCSDDRAERAVPAAVRSAAQRAAAADDDEAMSKADLAKLGAQIASQATGLASARLTPHGSVLAIPFGAPAGDAAARKLADATFAQMYGSVAIAHHGGVDLVTGPLASSEPSAAVALGHEHHASYVLFGAVDDHTPASLVVKIVGVADGAVLWSQAYPAADADAARIAADVNAKLQSLAAR